MKLERGDQGRVRGGLRGQGIALWLLPPRSPELNGRVGRMQATWRYEFYAVYDPPRQLDRLNPPPHDALGQITPKAYLDSLRAAEIQPSHMC